jgi:Ca2+-transporting ATPase
MRSPNRALLWVFGGALVFLGLVLYVPALQKIFHFGTLSAVDIAISFGAAILSIAWFEVLKLFLKRKSSNV